jgi:hypothetical protein
VVPGLQRCAHLQKLVELIDLSVVSMDGTGALLNEKSDTNFMLAPDEEVETVLCAKECCKQFGSNHFCLGWFQQGQHTVGICFGCI